jgi:polyketide biosynthesis acyl carrier protein
MQASDVSRESIEAVVREVIGVVLPSLPPEAIVGHKHLKELGADSVDRVEIILMLIDRLGIDEPMTSFAAVPNIDGLVSLLHSRCSG